MSIKLIVLTRGVYHFFGKYQKHPITTGLDIYPVLSKTTDERLSELSLVDKYVHNTFEAKNDVFYKTNRATDNWNFLSTQGISEGDCEDFAITKIQYLLELGWSIDHLTLELGYDVRASDFETFHRTLSYEMLVGHAWVVARWGGDREYVLDQGDGILESRAEIKERWGYYGFAQIKGTLWARVKENGDVSTEDYDQFEITPMPYRQVKMPVVTMTGTVRRK